MRSETIFRIETIVASLLVGLLAAAPALAQELPKRPEEIEFPELTFEPPEAKAYRHELEQGVVAFLAPSAELPLVEITFTFKGGRYLLEPGDEGVAGAMVAMLRRGGTATVKASDFDERLDFLAADLSVGSTDYTITASLDTLKDNLQKGFLLMVEMLRSPGFQEDKFALYKAEVLEGLKKRNDRADSIFNREWSNVLNGSEHFKSRALTKAKLDALTVEKLRAFHARVIHPGNLIISVTGDFETKDMIDRLNKVLASWKPGAEKSGPAPAPTQPVVPGVYYVEKDIPQGKVNIGLRGIQRDDPDAFALSVMSSILGSSGFTSRITNRVRTEEGLAYSAYAVAIPGLYFEGEIRAAFESKSRTCALATKLILEEFEKIRSEPVSDKELNTAKGAMIQSFPTTFGSKSQTLGVFVNDEMTGRDPGYWKSYRDKVQAVTKEDVQRVAKKYLLTDKVAILVVGKWDEIAKGDLDGRATMAEFFGGEATEIPLKDPLTLEPLKK